MSLPALGMKWILKDSQRYPGSANQIAPGWLVDRLTVDYHLTMEEATQVMGSSLDYKITEAVDLNLEIAVMVKKNAYGVSKTMAVSV